MQKKKKNSVIENVVIVILIVLVVVVFGVNLLFFNANSAPNLFGKKVYVTNVSDIEGISANSAVISDAAAVDTLTPGNVVLVFTGNDTEKAVLRIQQIDTEEDGNTYFYVKNDVPDSSSSKIGKDNIIAKCEWSSPEIGKFITFSKSNLGIVLLLILPCIILILIQSMHLLANKKDLNPESDDDVMDYDESTGGLLGENENENENEGETASPLFDPETAPESQEQADKLAGIADNFADKNPQTSSSYDDSELSDFSKEFLEVKGESGSSANNSVYEGEDKSSSEDEIVYINDDTPVSVPVEEPAEKVSADDEIVYLGEPSDTASAGAVKIIEPEKPEAPKKKVVKRVVKKRRPVSNPSASKPPVTPKSKYSAESIDELLKSIEEEKSKLK